MTKFALLQKERYTNEKDRSDKLHQLQVGDTLTLDDAKFLVRNIVPKDKEKKIVGWLELTRVK